MQPEFALVGFFFDSHIMFFSLIDLPRLHKVKCHCSAGNYTNEYVVAVMNAAITETEVCEVSLTHRV